METDRAAQLFVERYPELVAAQTRLLRNRHDAEDCVQEAFLALLDAPDVEHERAWLHEVSRRRSVDVLRYRDRVERAVDRLGWQSPVHAVDVADEVVERDEARLAVELILDMPETAKAVVAEIADGSNTHAAAENLGITHRSAESHLQRARSVARTFLHRVIGWLVGLLAIQRRLRSWRRVRRVAVLATATSVAAMLIVVTAPTPTVSAPPGRQKIQQIQQTATRRTMLRARTGGHQPSAQPLPTTTGASTRRRAAGGTSPLIPAPSSKRHHVGTYGVPGVVDLKVDTVDNGGGYQGPVEAVTWCLDNVEVDLHKVGC